MKSIKRRICLRRGHDWFPDAEPREFITSLIVCFRCKEKKILMPYGTCLTGHPMRQHYNVTPDNQLVFRHVPGCAGPQ